MATVAAICARGGSKGVPGKNIRVLQGRPLIEWSILQALDSGSIDEVFVSTDSPEIADIASRAGAIVPGLRPLRLAADDTPKIPVLEHLVEQIEASGRHVDRLVDLQATSPLRTSGDIDGAIALLRDGVDVVFSAYADGPNPYFVMVERSPDGSAHRVVTPTNEIVGRQQAPRVFTMNGSIYCWARGSLSRGLWGGRAVIYEMPRIRSVDVDDEFDWEILELAAERTGVLRK